MDFKVFIGRCFVLACFLMAAFNTLLGDEDIPSTRSNPEDFEAAVQLSDPKDILKGFPAFIVDDRTPFLEGLDYFPCTDCHGEDQPPDPRVRILEEEHDTIKLVHGAGRFWCLTCHDTQNRDNLVSLKSQKITFTDSYLLCGQCHFQRQKDFFYGCIIWMLMLSIILEKYLYIMGLALSLSTISIIYGLYYLFNLIYVMKTSTKVKKAQSYLLSAFMYLLIIPLFLIIIWIFTLTKIKNWIFKSQIKS